MKSASVRDGKIGAGTPTPRSDEARLVERGVAGPARARLDLERFLAGPTPRLPDGCSASRLVPVERAEGR